jgi:hypothetical protein
LGCMRDNKKSLIPLALLLNHPKHLTDSQVEG